MANARDSYFGYLNQDDDVSSRLGNIEAALGITAKGNPTLANILNPTQETTKKSSANKKLNRLINTLRSTGLGAIEDIKGYDKAIAKDAPEYADYLASQVRRGYRSPEEAADLFADFGMAYDVPGSFKVAKNLSTMSAGLPLKESVARYRPFQEFAARQLGLSLSEEDVKSTEEAARALGKTSPEEFSQFLGQKMLSSPQYIRKNPLAFTANLPYGGKYGVGYQTPEGTFTGTYRFKPTSTVQYS